LKPSTPYHQGEIESSRVDKLDGIIIIIIIIIMESSLNHALQFLPLLT